MIHNSSTPLAQPFGPDFEADPYGVFAQLREKGSAHRIALPDGSPVWLITRECDVRRGLADPRFSVDKQHSGSGFKGFSLPPALDANLLNLDAGDHLRLRRLVAQGFTPRHVDGMRNHIQRAVDTFVRQLLGRLETDGQADLVAEFAKPLPLMVIGDLFVIPAEEQGQFSEWTSGMLTPTSGEELVRSIGSIHQYLVNLVASRRASPGDDILSGLIAARDEEDRLTEDELVSLAFLILGAGSENVQHQISNAVVTLLDHPEQLSELREKPELLPAGGTTPLRPSESERHPPLPDGAGRRRRGPYPRGRHGALLARIRTPRPGPIPAGRPVRHPPRRQGPPGPRPRPPLLPWCCLGTHPDHPRP